ncbi:MAG TPA: (Fe-S)-binding protein [Myxococcota bacterium]|nr:(Fe-S)-binding protein [Myxococcota bacterium]
MQEERAAAPIREGFEEIYARSLDCVHCGLCLPTCPTYVETGRETSSPRGRIYLMRGVAEGRIPLADAVADEAYLCLGCRACETACPSGVRFGSMLERLRHEVEKAGMRSGLARALERFALRHVVPHRRRLRAAVDLLGLAQRLGLVALASRVGPRALRDAPALLPQVPPRRARAPLPEHVPAEGAQRGRVAFFSGCVMSELFAETNAATVRVLAREGFDVWVPRGQGCCGALLAHAGDAPTAHALARHNLAAFDLAGVDAIVTNSAGCGAALRDAGDWLPGEGSPFAAKIRDVCEWLDLAGLRAPMGELSARVCYDDPCHLVHGQRVSAAPRRLLAAVPGLRLVAHENPGACCGAAGTYNLTQPAMSRAVLERKIATLAAADPDLVATGNPGCLMQLRAGLARAGLRARAVHPIEILDQAQRTASQS